MIGTTRRHTELVGGFLRQRLEKEARLVESHLRAGQQDCEVRLAVLAMAWHLGMTRREIVAELRRRGDWWPRSERQITHILTTAKSLVEGVGNAAL